MIAVALTFTPFELGLGFHVWAYDEDAGGIGLKVRFAVWTLELRRVPEVEP